MGWLLALALLAQTPPSHAMAMTRTQLFDHASIALPGAGPWQLVVRTKSGWEEIPADVFGEATGEFSIHFRARDLAVSDTGAVPEQARWRVRVSTGDETREGFLVPGEPATQQRVRLSGNAISSDNLALDFTNGSGFYRNLRTEDGILAMAIGFRIGGRALGFVPFERTDADFRFADVRSEGGQAFLRRRASVAVRALVRWSDPRPSVAYLGPELIEQEILVDLPRALVLLGRGVDVENWFALGSDVRVLLPDRARLESPRQTVGESSYEWIVIATPAGAIVHWLELPGPASVLAPQLSIRKSADRGWHVGYRLRRIEDRWASADPEEDGVVMVQRVAWLGGPEFVKSLDDPAVSLKLVQELSEPVTDRRVELEKLP